MRRGGIWIVALLAGLTGCSAGAGGRQPPGRAAPLDTSFVLTGDPEAPGGATWRYRARAHGVAYDLTGVLLKPPGAGPFPAVLLSHGAGGSATGYGVALGREMVRWGLVCIAVNYTHAGPAPLGAPGDATQRGASAANVLRAQRTYELLRRLGYVDMKRVAAHGYSAGGFVTAALVAAHPGEFRVASHSAAGVRPGELAGGPAPGLADVEWIRTPYQIHHGDADDIVPLAWDVRLDSLLTAHHVPHELRVYPGETHMGLGRSPLVLQRVREWYAKNGMF